MSSTVPSGTITFLFTDIEGSTQLWEKYPEAMRSALAKHDSLLRKIFESNNGHVFKIVGDAFCVAFASPSDALNASLESQRALQTESWGETVIRVRMALHTGEVEARDNDYFGTTVNRVARIMSAGHGGQILVSQDTQAQLQNNVLPAITLKEIGKHRMKGLMQLEQLYQVVAADLPSDFPRLNTLDISPNNLPLELTSFVERENEIAEIKHSLSTSRLVTLTGAGGCGKTRLSLEAASQLQSDYPNGVWFVELAPITDPALVPQTVAATLGVPEQPSKTVLTALIDFLRAKTLLLVIDNCEHLIQDCARLAESLLKACPKLRVLASSRESMGVSGEVSYRVPSLEIPDPKQKLPVDQLLRYGSIQLFVERAKTVLPSFAVTANNALALTQVCHRLDGIPLAIELAAARVKMLKVEQIAARLDDSFRLLTGGSRTALPRQQTLRALIDWSYNLLSESERKLLCRLSVFASGWTLEAAEDVCVGEGIESVDVLDLLSQLASKSLVTVEREQGDDARYRLLETVRQYARDRLLDLGEGTLTRDRHFKFFRKLVEQAEPKVRSADQLAALKQLDIEYENLRAAIAWSVSGDVIEGLNLASLLMQYWRLRGSFSEGRQHLISLLSRPEAQLPTTARALALTVLGEETANLGNPVEAKMFLQQALTISQAIGDQKITAQALWILAFPTEPPKETRKILEQSLALYRALDDRWFMANVMRTLARAAMITNDYDYGHQLLQESLALAKKTGDRWLIGRVSETLGFAAELRGDLAEARSFYQRCLEICREMGDVGSLERYLNHLGEVARTQGEYAAAMAFYEEANAHYQQVNGKSADFILINQGYTALHLQNWNRAIIFLQEGLQLSRQRGGQDGIALCLTGFAAVATAEQRYERAARLMGAACIIAGEHFEAWAVVDRAEYDHILADARAHLDEVTFNAAWAEGRAMTMEQAIEYALDENHD